MKCRKWVTRDYFLILRKKNSFHNFILIVSVIFSLYLNSSIVDISFKEIFGICLFVFTYSLFYIFNDIRYTTKVEDKKREIPCKSIVLLSIFVLTPLNVIWLKFNTTLAPIWILIFSIFMVHNLFYTLRFITNPLLHLLKYIILGKLLLLEEKVGLPLWFISSVFFIVAWEFKKYKKYSYGNKPLMISLVLFIFGGFLLLNSEIEKFFLSLIVLYIGNFIAKQLVWRARK